MSVTLYANDSINLSTGKVTRSNDKSSKGTVRERIMADSIKRMRRNDLNAVAYVLRHMGD
jgi:hypothetical protein